IGRETIRQRRYVFFTKSYGQSDDGAVHRLDKLGRVPTNFAVLFLKPASIRPTQRSRRLNIVVTGYEHWLTNTVLLASYLRSSADYTMFASIHSLRLRRRRGGGISEARARRRMSRRGDCAGRDKRGDDSDGPKFQHDLRLSRLWAGEFFTLPRSNEYPSGRVEG